MLILLVKLRRPDPATLDRQYNDLVHRCHAQSLPDLRESKLDRSSVAPKSVSDFLLTQAFHSQQVQDLLLHRRQPASPGFLFRDPSKGVVKSSLWRVGLGGSWIDPLEFMQIQPAGSPLNCRGDLLLQNDLLRSRHALR
jgi:hypothetical protein